MEQLPTLSRWVYYGAVTGVLGTALFHFLVLERSVAPGPEKKALVRRAVATWATKASALMVLATVGILIAQLIDFHDPFETWTADLKLLLTGTTWGRVWIVQAAVTVALTAAAWRARSRPAGGPTWAVLLVLALAAGFMPALSGHSFGAERLRAATIAFDGIHVWASGLWIGILFVLPAAGRAHLRGDESVGSALHEWVSLFSPLAMVGATVLGLTGAWASWIHLGSVEALVGTGYGRILLFKLVLLGGVLGLGAYHARRLLPRLREPEVQERFYGVTAPLEMILALVVLLATATLVGTPPPMH